MRDEDEELQLALALSASEQQKEEDDAQQRRRRLEELSKADAALARSLQERETSGGSSGGSFRGGGMSSKLRGLYEPLSLLTTLLRDPSSAVTRAPTAAPAPAPARAPAPLVQKGTCYRCRASLTFGAKLTALERDYCPDCFRCEGCDCSLAGGQFFPHAPPLTTTTSPGSSSAAALLDPYCKTCVQELFAFKCCVCADFLEGRFLKHAFFEDEKYCVFHEDMRRVCFACARLEPAPKTGREQFTELPDGRASCGRCIMTAVLDSAEAKPLYLEAVDFIERELMLRIPPGMREVPVLAVDLPSLNEQKAHNSKKRGSTIRGLTMYQTSTVRHIPAYNSYDPVRQVFATVTPTPLYISQQREVTAVLVLYGLPRDLAASILAHEATHVLLKLTPEFPVDLSPFAEEGICQYVAEKYLQWREIQSLSSSSSSASSSASSLARVASGSEERKRDDQLRKYFSFSINSDPSPVYGDGFRAAAAAIGTLGIGEVLEHIKATRELPIV